MADAYFSAREWNAGATSLLIRANPRITAILNLLTKGFGYFYLGDRIKGVVCFLVICAAQIALLLRTNVWTSAFAVTMQIAVAADGYRVARQRSLANHPNLDRSQDGGPGPIELANPTGLQPAIASALFLAFGTTTVVGYGALQALDGHTVTTMGTLEQGPSGLLYRNSHEHIEITAPDGWEYTQPAGTLAELSGRGCSIIVMEQFAIDAVGTSIDANEKELLKHHPDAEITRSQPSLAGHSAQSFEASFTNASRVAIRQRYIASRRGFKIVIVIETWVDPEQRQILDGIEQTLSV